VNARLRATWAQSRQEGCRWKLGVQKAACSEVGWSTGPAPSCFCFVEKVLQLQELAEKETGQGRHLRGRSRAEETCCLVRIPREEAQNQAPRQR
jgi:hypothetical protein